MKSVMVGLWLGLCCFYLSVEAQPYTWADDIASIFYSKCTSCHHSGGIAPFSLMDYSSASLYSSAIKVAVQSGAMPPWPPDTTYTRFVHERVLTAAEVQKIVDWVDAGSPSGNLANAPAPPSYSNGYQLPGTPDMVVTIPPYASQASSTDEYVCFSIPISLPTLRYVKAVEVVPGNPAIVHHVIVSADTSSFRPTTTTIYPNCYNIMGQIGVAGYTPGAGPIIFPSVSPAKFGIPLYPNCNIVFQMHYPAGSAGQMDSTQIRLFFYPAGEPDVRQVYSATLLQNWSFSVPADSVVTFANECWTSGIFADCRFPIDMTVLACYPHHHLVGTQIVNFAVSPNLLDTVPLVRINKWNFNWQGYYFYKKPVKVPANYKWIGYHTYDNTTSNPNNPHNPPQTVSAGYQTTDEMLFDTFIFAIYQPGDEHINMDSLMDISTSRVYHSPDRSTQFYVYPNPAHGEVWITLPPAFYQQYPYRIQIKDAQGRSLLASEQSHSYQKMNISSLAPGFYIVEVLKGDEVLASQKLLIAF